MYHGGPKGLKEILPRTKTAVKGQEAYGNKVAKPDKVYVTSDYHAALMYASQFKKGSVYYVEPIGHLEHDEDCISVGLSFTCDAARVLKEERQPPSHLAKIRQWMQE